MTTAVQYAEIAYKDYVSFDKAFDFAKELMARGDAYSKDLGAKLMKESLRGQQDAMERFEKASKAAQKEGKGSSVEKFKIDVAEYTQNVSAAGAVGATTSIDGVSGISKNGKSGFDMPKNEAAPEPPPAKKKKSFWQKLGKVFAVVAVVAAVALAVTACVVTCGAAVPGVVAAAGLTSGTALFSAAGTMMAVGTTVNGLSTPRPTP